MGGGTIGETDISWAHQMSVLVDDMAAGQTYEIAVVEPSCDLALSPIPIAVLIADDHAEYTTMHENHEPVPFIACRNCMSNT